ncbi:hypothetical protein ABRY23_02815 [Melioribacteraceae bacterium 4301-Me]|uniref:hypothetical protein n=1 Tax=Pyranulibacter aquaticus TaxID=3163344 RepID=UPI003598DAE2
MTSKKLFTLFLYIYIFGLYFANTELNAKPTFLSGLVYISKYIASKDFIKLKQSNSDIELVDSIYITAVRYYESDISEALLCLTFALLPFNKMSIILPIVNIKITFPLLSAAEKIFSEKLKYQPKNIFFDSPTDDLGDKDKLSHFFGNAFLSYNVRFFNLSKFMGIFVELFEATLKIQGSIDHRDILTNYLGELFGKALKENSKLLPSEVLKIYSLLFLRANL